MTTKSDNLPERAEDVLDLLYARIVRNLAHEYLRLGDGRHASASATWHLPG